MFSFKVCEIFKKSFFIEHLRWLLQSCGSRYTVKTELNAKVSWNELNNPTKSSEQLKHLRNNVKTSKNIQSSWIAFWKPDLIEEKFFERLGLFKNGVP